MNKSQNTYYGTWWIPTKDNCQKQEFNGVLSYCGDDTPVLILYGVGFCTHFPRSFDTIHGKTYEGLLLSLFNVQEFNYMDSGESRLKAQFILEGEHIDSLEAPAYEQCVIKYPNLREWAFLQRVDISMDEKNREVLSLDIESKGCLVDFELEDDLQFTVLGQMSDHFSRYDINIEQNTIIKISAGKKKCVSSFLHICSEFSNFLSLALFSGQYPNELLFMNRDDRCVKLHYKVKPSAKHVGGSIIKYEKLKDRLPIILSNWHKDYSKISPIIGHLVNSFSRENEFEPTDFLIIMQAMEGYHKRFRNKNDGKDVRKFEDEINLLLEHFKDVEMLKEIDIDPHKIRITRDFYTHLYMGDEEPDIITNYEELFWLTQQCKILLVCCMLDYMGMTTEEINESCNNSPLSFVIHTIQQKKQSLE